MTTHDIYWLAGMMEGEGYFRNTKGCCPIISFTSTDFDIAVRVSLLLDATIWGYQPGNLKHKRAYRVDISGRKAAGWMLTLYSLLGQRRKQKIRELLAAWRLIPARRMRVQ